ncbi:hypothetical protein D3C79_488670 [compost metagenome]
MIGQQRFDLRTVRLIKFVETCLIGAPKVLLPKIPLDQRASYLLAALGGKHPLTRLFNACRTNIGQVLEAHGGDPHRQVEVCTQSQTIGQHHLDFVRVPASRPTGEEIFQGNTIDSIEPPQLPPQVQ